MLARTCRIAILASVCALAACATAPGAPDPVVATATAPAAAAAAAAAIPSAQAIANAQRLAGAPGSTAAATPPSTLRSFADVSRDAKELTGLFRVWQKDEKVWLEIEPAQFDQPFFFSTNLDQGLGENGFFAGSMSSSLSRRFGSPQIVMFRKVGPNVQMIARNVKYTAQAGSPEARAVAAGFSDSLLASAAIASQPHPERKSVLVEANALFLNDLPGAAMRLEQSYRQSYAFDSRNSYFGQLRSKPTFTSLNVTAHYTLSRVATPAAGQPATEPPSTVPDIRSLFLGFHYSLAKLPDTPMPTRVADNRIGYFSTERWDFTTDDRRIPIKRYVNRWRLAKKDPAAALSEPDRTDRLLDRPQRAGTLSRRDPRWRAGVEQGVRAHRLPERDQGGDPAGGRRFQYFRHPACVDPLDDQHQGPASTRSVLRWWTRAPAKSSTPTSASTAPASAR